MKLAEMADEARIVEAEGEADAVRNAAELSGLRSELQSLQARLDHAHGEHSETAAEMAQLKAQLSDTITQKLIADEKLSTLMEENERDKINLSAASTNFSELSLQQASDQIQYEVLTQECEDLRAEVATLNARVKELLPYERLHRVTNARQNEVGGARIDIPGVETDANLGVGRDKAGSGRIRAV
jgi:chromosome segregation ATPase